MSDSSRHYLYTELIGARLKTPIGCPADIAGGACNGSVVIEHAGRVAGSGAYSLARDSEVAFTVPVNRALRRRIDKDQDGATRQVHGLANVGGVPVGVTVTTSSPTAAAPSGAPA